MKIETQDFNNTSVMTIKGDMEGEFAGSLNGIVEKTVAAGKAGMVLDMRECGFIDSSGLEMLLKIKQYSYEHNCQIRLACMDGNLRKILEVTRLDSEFESFDELADAVNSFA